MSLGEAQTIDLQDYVNGFLSPAASLSSLRRTIRAFGATHPTHGFVDLTQCLWTTDYNTGFLAAWGTALGPML